MKGLECDARLAHHFVQSDCVSKQPTCDNERDECQEHLAVTELVSIRKHYQCLLQVQDNRGCRKEKQVEQQSLSCHDMYDQTINLVHSVHLPYLILLCLLSRRSCSDSAGGEGSSGCHGPPKKRRDESISILAFIDCLLSLPRYVFIAAQIFWVPALVLLNSSE